MIRSGRDRYELVQLHDTGKEEVVSVQPSLWDVLSFMRASMMGRRGIYPALIVKNGVEKYRILPKELANSTVSDTCVDFYVVIYAVDGNPSDIDFLETLRLDIWA